MQVVLRPSDFRLKDTAVTRFKRVFHHGGYVDGKRPPKTAENLIPRNKPKGSFQGRGLPTPTGLQMSRTG